METGVMPVGSLAGKVALVAGATRGAGRGIAVQLGAAGATVYCTGRTTRAARSEMNRPETIEETAALVDQAGGRGIAVQVDHLVPGQVRALVARIEDEQGALHVLVNDIFGATAIEWNKSVWESSLDTGLHTLRLAVETHAITSHFALPLLIKSPGGLVVEVNDGTAEYNATHYRVSFFYDLADRKSTRLNSSHSQISYAVFCLKKKNRLTYDTISPSCCLTISSISSRHSPIVWAT